ncbi:actin-like ATPase domain-containing protein [Exidia glandulosa HHB12029]|uniref:Actin-like ATPase domain-containing protein n=1 Tax=Exidia glandulosa HHB12029 TaxID=1314781 RepID=A0A165NUR6_EXIGL|nr:actin-like ATPase domain-containing protein [Exidia glandulosa HHB12029]
MSATPAVVPPAQSRAQPMRFTSFYIPPPLTTKQSTSTYGRGPEQSVFSRRKIQANEELMQGVKRGYYTLVIHPGSRTLRIGRACEVVPVSVTHAIARRKRTAEKGKQSEPDTQVRRFGILTAEQGLLTAIDGITHALRERMRFYKLHISSSAKDQCQEFNTTSQPEIIQDHNDPGRVEWLGKTTSADFIVGDEVWRAGDPAEWLVRFPLNRGFNSAAYPSGSLQEVLGDLQTIWSEVLRERLNILPKDYPLYSVVLVVPDLPERGYVSALTRLLLADMSFKQLAIQQESLAATYGAGLSTALVVDVGAATTNIACVDEGWVVPDTRISLDVGGDDITELFIRLLKRTSSPWAMYGDVRRVDDFMTGEKMKFDLASLAEEHVALNMYDFVVRQYDGPTAKARVKVYDEPVLAAMVIFEPQAIDYDAKRSAPPLVAPLDAVTEDIGDQPGEGITQAMVFSTQHLSPHGLDIPREAAKLPVDVAVFNSARAVGAEDKVRRMLSSVLLVGGGAARIRGVNAALETRLSAIAAGRVAGMDTQRVVVVSPAKDVDARVLCWKGGSVFARMDSIPEFWVSRDEWEMVGNRGLKERWWHL